MDPRRPTRRLNYSSPVALFREVDLAEVHDVCVYIRMYVLMRKHIKDITLIAAATHAYRYRKAARLEEEPVAPGVEALYAPHMEVP